jgi:hypothetical protein
MLNTPLLETLRLLDKNEWQQLDRFVHSRFFAHTDNASGVVALFEILKNHAPKFDDPEALSRTKIATALGQSEQYVAKVGSGLHAVVRRFLGWAYQIGPSQDFQEQLGLLRFYHEKDLPIRFKSLAEKLQVQLNQEEHPTNREHLFQQFQFNSHRSEWMQDYQPIQDINLLQTLHYLDSYYLLQKAQIVFNLILKNQNAAFQSIDYFPFLEYVKNILAEQSEPNPLLQLYYEAILLLLDQDDSNFEHFQALLQQHHSSLAQYDYHSLSSLERQIILQKFNAGAIHLLKEVFSLYKRHLEHGLIQVEGKLTATSFANIVRYACRCGELKWVEHFLDQYQAEQLIGINNPQDFYRLHFAYFLIAKGNLDEAEHNLSLDFEDSIRKVDARCLELMVLYQKQSSLLEYKIESFRKLVRNTAGLPEIRRNGFHNFALAIRKMSNPDLKRNDKRIDKLVAEIQNTPTSESFWLIEQLKQLKSHRGQVSH